MKDHAMYVDGQWCAAASGAYYEALNPALGQAFARVPEGGREDARRAIEAAGKAAPGWARTPLAERAALCERMAEVLEARQEALAEVLCTEQGKPRHGEALDEAAATPRFYRVAAEQARCLEGATLPVRDPHKRVLTLRRPRGVVAVITPWNFPAGIPGEYLPYAIVMGNTVVWTPAPTAALTAIVVMEALVEAGVPRGVINLVTGPGAEVGDELVVHPGTHAIGMTGSPRTGRLIAARAGLKPTLMELGGNGPAIVLADADPERAAQALARSCYYNAGQVCSAAERILVAEPLKKDLVEALVEEAKQWVPGDPREKSVNLGPQNNPAVLKKVSAHVADASAKGARIAAGGKRPDLPGFFYQPTVLEDFPPDALLNREETFGPVAPVASFRDEEQAWAYINACGLGLSSAVFTRDLERAWHWAEALRTGLTVVNDGTIYWEPNIPFGGMAGTSSGLGRIGGRHTLEFMSDVKTIAFHVGEA